METHDFSGVIGGRGYAMFEQAYPHFKEIQEAIVDHVQFWFDATNKYQVLELGCGPGPTTNALLQKRKNIFVTAVDNEKQMIDEAKVNLAKYGERVNFVLEDMLTYLKKVPDNTFDACASGWTLHNLEKTERHKVLEQIYRVLKQPGFFVNGDKYAQENLLEHKKAYDWSISSLKAIGKKYNDENWADEWKKHMEYDERPEISMPLEDALKEMEDIGFKHTSCLDRIQMEAIVVGMKK
jgi:ubiquinone/menaquinone biosynthesis C-methylase UbiE